MLASQPAGASAADRQEGLAAEMEQMREALRRQEWQLEQQRLDLGELQRQSAAAARILPVSGSLAGPELIADEYECTACDDSPCLCDGYDCGPLITIGGQYRLMYNSANFDFHDATLSNQQPSQNFFNQRFRTWLSVFPNDCVEGYLQMEMGHIGWGENFDFPKTYVGPRFPSADDRVGMEVRYGYLGYRNETLGRLRAGIQPWQDSYGQTLASSDWDFSVGGLSWERYLPSLDSQMLMGIFALYEGQVQNADDAMLLTLDLEWEPADDWSWGLSAYYLPDSGVYSYPTAAPYADAWDVWLGMHGSWQGWAVPLNAFAIYNRGRRNELGGAPSFQHDGAALKVELGPVPMGPGDLSFQALYSTGEGDPNTRNSNEFRTVAQSARDNFGSQGYWSYLVLTSPHGPSDVNDLGVSLQNRSLGLFTAQAKYEFPLANCLQAMLAAGWLQSSATNPVSGSKDMGTELAGMLTLDLSGGLKIDFGAAALFTGDFYRPSTTAPTPDDLWEVFTRAQLEF